jgi:tetratricopeptide (TPR) repeat protein
MRLRFAPLLVPALLSVAASPSAAQLLVESRERVEELRSRVRRDSCDVSLYYALGMALLSRREFDAADSAFLQAVTIDPQFAEGWVGAAIAQLENTRLWNRLRRRGDTAVARERAHRTGMLRRAFLIDPFVNIAPREGDYSATAFEYGQRFMARELQRTHSRDSLPPGLLWEHALLSIRTFHWAEAIADFESLRRIFAARERDDTTGAVPLSGGNVLYMLAALQLRNGDAEQAIRLYRQTIGEDLGNYMAHVQLARIHEVAEEWPDAVRERRAAVEVFPENATLVSDLGLTLYRSGALAESEETLLQARAMNQRDPLIPYRLGVVEDAQGKRDAARASLELFLRLAPSGLTTPIADARRRLSRMP